MVMFETTEEGEVSTPHLPITSSVEFDLEFFDTVWLNFDTVEEFNEVASLGIELPPPQHYCSSNFMHQ